MSNKLPIDLDHEDISVLTFPEKGSYVAAFFTDDGAVDVNLYRQAEDFNPPDQNREYFVHDFSPVEGTCILMNLHPENGVSFGLWPNKETLDAFVAKGNEVAPAYKEVTAINDLYETALNIACGITGVNELGEPLLTPSTIPSEKFNNLYV